MKKLLVTGFDPFGAALRNPSWEAVQRLPDRIGDYRLRKLGFIHVPQLPDQETPNIPLEQTIAALTAASRLAKKTFRKAKIPLDFFSDCAIIQKLSESSEPNMGV